MMVLILVLSLEGGEVGAVRARRSGGIGPMLSAAQRGADPQAFFLFIIMCTITTITIIKYSLFLLLLSIHINCLLIIIY